MTNANTVNQKGAECDLKNPGVATLLSVLCPGLGQLYNGDYAKAQTMFLVWCVSLLLCLVFVGIFPAFFVWCVSVDDAFTEAIALNNSHNCGYNNYLYY